MQPRSRKVLLAVATVGVLCLCGCAGDQFVLEHPLPFVVDDRIVGSWAEQDGKLSEVIRRGDGQSYVALSSDDVVKNGKGSVFYLARAGDALFAEGEQSCDQFYFHPPATDKTCWFIVKLNLSGDSLAYQFFDTRLIVRASLAGQIKDVSLMYGVSAEKGTNSNFSADVLIEGMPSEVAPFLAKYAAGAVYGATVVQMHRI